MVAPKEIKSEKEVYKGSSYQAYQILRLAYALTSIIGGIDKFYNYLTNWEMYLAEPFNVFNNAHTTMLVMGVAEIIIGIGVLLKPRIFAYIAMFWLLGLIINLLLLQNFYNIALSDFGLLLGALALARLSSKYDA